MSEKVYKHNMEVVGRAMERCKGCMSDPTKCSKYNPMHQVESMAVMCFVEAGLAGPVMAPVEKAS